MIPDDNLVQLKTVPFYQRCSFVKDLQGGEAIRVITRESDLLDDTRMLVNQTRAIVDSNDRWFEFIAPEKPGNRFHIRGENRFKALVAQLKRDWDELYALFPQHSFNPYATLFLESSKVRPRLLELAALWPKLTPLEVPLFFHELDGFIQDLRARGRDKEFRRHLHRIARRCRKNYREGLRYVRRIFGAGSRHLVHRWELGYFSGDLVTPTQVISAQEVRKHLAKLQRYLRETFPMSGFMWKLEFGMLKGHHFHVLAFMNGHLVREGQTIANQVKRYWEEDATEGRGIFYACKAGDYEEPGIGLINYYDEQKRSFLEKNVLPYLVKADFWLSYEPGGRTFGKGLMPLGAPKVGRRRSRHSPRIDEEGRSSPIDGSANTS